MDLVLQDLAVSGIALGAALVLLQRVRSTFSAARKKPSCGTCPGCEDHRGGVVSSQVRR
jgi:hypothetical protein